MELLNKQLVKLLAAELSHSWIADYLNVPISIVEDAENGIFQVEPPLPPKLPKQQPTKLKPVTRPFPVLDGMSDTKRIIALSKHGLSAQKIQKHLTEPISVRRITRYAKSKLGPITPGTNGIDNLIGSTFMPYIHECLRRLGKDRFTCELCLEPVPKGCVVHHTKYEGATVYDLMYICTSCNLSRTNKGLV